MEPSKTVDGSVPKSLSSLVSRLDRLDSMTRCLERKSHSARWASDGEDEVVQKELVPLDLALKEAESKGSLLDRIASIEERLIQIKMVSLLSGDADSDEGGFHYPIDWDEFYQRVEEEKERDRKLTKPFQKPPIEMPNQVRMSGVYPARKTLVFTYPPTPTYPEENFNDLVYVVGSRRLKCLNVMELILKPQDVVENNLKMLSTQEPYVIPAHLPDLVDCESIAPVIAAIVKWWLTTEDKNIILPPEFAFMVDPVPMFPLSVEAFWITNYKITLKVASYSNAIISLRVYLPRNQTLQTLHITAKTVFKERSNSRNCIASFEPFMVGEELPSHLPSLPSPHIPMKRSDCWACPLSILGWNARGVARHSFKKNLLQLVKGHDPDMVFISEIRTSTSNTHLILSDLPFDKFQYAEPTGICGGMLLLWQSSRISYTSMTDDNKTLNGFVQGPLSRHQPQAISQGSHTGIDSKRYKRSNQP